MTNQEAEEVLSLLVAGFINMTMESRSVEVWTRLMAELEDPEAAALTAIDYARFDDKFPSFSDFRRSYIKKRKDFAAKATKSAAVAALDAGPVLEAPRWVKMWHELRAAGDMRAFPEQEKDYLRQGMVWPPVEGVVTVEQLLAWKPGTFPKVEGAGALIRSMD